MTLRPLLSPESYQSEISRIDTCQTAVAVLMSPQSIFDDGERYAVGELLAYLCERRCELQDELEKSLKAAEAADRLYEAGVRRMGLDDQSRENGGAA